MFPETTKWVSPEDCGNPKNFLTSKFTFEDATSGDADEVAEVGAVDRDAVFEPGVDDAGVEVEALEVTTDDLADIDALPST
jgi:hypothetical protein